MDLTDFEEKLLRRLRQANLRLELTEVQPPQADMVQPLVSPPDAGELVEEPAALARRLEPLGSALTLMGQAVAARDVERFASEPDEINDAYEELVTAYKTLMQGTEGQDAP